jgi:formylglycine-generating enzyme required for sulfatase activity
MRSQRENQIWVERDGYLPWTETVVLEGGERRTLHVELKADIAPELVRIERGCFEMGSPEDESARDHDERRHWVCVEDFEIGKYEVTLGEYRRFVEATAGAERANGCWASDLDDPFFRIRPREGVSWHKPSKYQQNRDDHPVVCVSFHDALDYIAWLNRETGDRYRLPTEAEWEYAARAGTRTARYWGEDPDHDQACDYANVADRKPLPGGRTWIDPHACNDGYAFAAAVGRLRANGSGLHDMLGNISEWTCSAYDRGYGGTEKRCAGASHTAGRVLRGGSWGDIPRHVRAAFRDWDPPDRRSDYVGFRVARTP